jgi:hypothetical protein
MQAAAAGRMTSHDQVKELLSKWLAQWSGPIPRPTISKPPLRSSRRTPTRMHEASRNSLSMLLSPSGSSRTEVIRRC